MDLSVIVAYSLACLAILIVPGPTVLLVVTYALKEGRRAAWSTIIGVGLGDLTAILLSFAGLGVLLSTSAMLFTVVRWIGAAYLVYLGIKFWRAPVHPVEDLADIPRLSHTRMLAHTWLVTALNPKGIVFFVAFVPQFIDPARPLLPQFMILGGIFLGLAIANAAAYAVGAGQLAQIFRDQRKRLWLNRGGGSALIAAGALTALSSIETES